MFASLAFTLAPIFILIKVLSLTYMQKYEENFLSEIERRLNHNLARGEHKS